MSGSFGHGKIIRERRWALRAAGLAAAAFLLSCDRSRESDLSYGSRLWRVYDDRRRFLLFGDRALPPGPYTGLAQGPEGLRVLGAANQDLAGSGPREAEGGLLSGEELLPKGRTLEGKFGARIFRVPLPCDPAGGLIQIWNLPGRHWILHCAGKLFVSGPGDKPAWKERNMAVYFGAPSPRLILCGRGESLIVAGAGGVALSRGYPFELWKVLGAASGLPAAAALDMKLSGGRLWLLYPDRLYRSSQELEKLLGPDFPPS